MKWKVLALFTISTTVAYAAEVPPVDPVQSGTLAALPALATGDPSDSPQGSVPTANPAFPINPEVNRPMIQPSASQPGLQSPMPSEVVASEASTPAPESATPEPSGDADQDFPGDAPRPTWSQPRYLGFPMLGCVKLPWSGGFTALPFANFAPALPVLTATNSLAISAQPLNQAPFKLKASAPLSLTPWAKSPHSKPTLTPVNPPHSIPIGAGSGNVGPSPGGTVTIAVPPAVTIPRTPSETGTANAAAASAACMAFGLDFYGQLVATSDYAAAKDKNVALSPLSLASVLEVLRLGTVNTAQQELSTALYADQLTPGRALGIPSFDGTNCPGVTLSSANSLWFDTHFLLKPAFVQAVQDEFAQDALYKTDFSSPASAAATINQWIGANTGGHINNLLNKADIPFNSQTQTQLVIANAAYFKGQWAKQFEKNATQNSPFRLVSGNTVQVPTMHSSGTYRYTVVDGIAVLELPYEGNSVSMILLLPVVGGASGQFGPGSVLVSGSLGIQLNPAYSSLANAQASLSGTGANTPPVSTAEALKNLETLLQGNWLDQAISKLSPQELDVALPRFEFGCQPEQTVNILKALGIKRIFDLSGDFAGMSDLMLQVGVVKHKAWLQVTEEGTEATAATIVGVMQTCAAVIKPCFSADHPFIFVIRHNATGMPLFLGRVSNPLSKE